MLGKSARAVHRRWNQYVRSALHQIPFAQGYMYETFSFSAMAFYLHILDNAFAEYERKALKKGKRALECHNCFKEGHFYKQCPNATMCRLCLKEHKWAKCPRVLCHWCRSRNLALNEKGGDGHLVKDCQNLKQNERMSVADIANYIAKYETSIDQKKQNLIGIKAKQRKSEIKY